MAELITRKENAIGWVIFSNPTKFNALTYDMWTALPGVIATYDADPEVRLIAFTGDGEKSFVSGSDISQFETSRGDASGQATYEQAVVAALEAPRLCGKPTLAKIRGVCMGGGMGLAAACDVRIAAMNATFCMPASRRGLGYNFPSIQRLVHLIGASHASDIFFSARKFVAAEALAMGLVNRVVDAADLDREFMEYCTLISENAPLTIAAAKFSISQSILEVGKRDLGQIARKISSCFTSADYQEGQRAFLEKRKPNFQGR